MPTDADGACLIGPTGGWVDDRLFALEVQMPGRPRQDWSKPPGHGTVFGLLICDAVAARRSLELPRPDEIWPRPLLRVAGRHVRLYGDDVAYVADRPAREWMLDEA